MLGKCGICFDWFSANASSIVTTMCGHVFHGACIKRWIAQNPTCVTCRKPIEEKDLRKLFVNFCSDNESETTVDGLKQKLHAKDLECIERDEKISEMRTHCARYESEISKKEKHIMNIACMLSQSELESSTKDEKIEELQACCARLEQKISEKDWIMKELQTSLSRSELESSKKDEKIHYLQIYSARSERELERILQQEMNIKNEISVWKSKVESYNHYEAKRTLYNEVILEHKSVLIDKEVLEVVIKQLGSVDTFNAKHAVATFDRYLINQKLARLKKTIFQLENELSQFEEEKTHLQTELQLSKDELKIS